MSKLRKSDIGKKISVCVKESPTENKLICKKIVIYDINNKTPNKIGFVEYPITLNSDIYPPFISSKKGIVGIVKNQRKESEEYLTKAGDWCFMDRVSRDEMRELERIAQYFRKTLN